MTSLVIVVPVRNEEQRIGDCLDAIARAVRRVRTHSVTQGVGGLWPTPQVQTVVVLDACTDHSAAVVSTYPWVRPVVTGSGRVGAARAIGVATGLRASASAPGRTWVANTDADSRVPPDWLTHQLDLAHTGVDVFCGLVDPDIGECGPAIYSAWVSDYQRRTGHPHIHGTSLGIRGDAYLACGGFDPDSGAQEDVQLVDVARKLGLNVAASPHAAVTTSGRTQGRVLGESFARYLTTCDLLPDLFATETITAT